MYYSLFKLKRYDIEELVMHICKTKIVANISPFYMEEKYLHSFYYHICNNFFSKILPSDVKLGNYF